MAQELRRLNPDTEQRIRENRDFLGRAVRALATTKGISQFLDVGSGLPTNDNVHQIVQRMSADSRVVYVDNDPVVARHAELLLTGTDLVTVLKEDVRNPASVLSWAKSMLDLSQPVALLLVAVLHFIPIRTAPGISSASIWTPSRREVTWYSRTPAHRHPPRSRRKRRLSTTRTRQARSPFARTPKSVPSSMALTCWSPELSTPALGARMRPSTATLPSAASWPA